MGRFWNLVKRIQSELRLEHTKVGPGFRAASILSARGLQGLFRAKTLEPLGLR
jgi:hypothetical protein